MTKKQTKQYQKIVSLIQRGERRKQILLKCPGLKEAQFDKIANDLNPATPETKAKLKFDPVQKLFQKGTIDSGDLRSADYIKAAYLLITADVTGRNASYETFIDRVGRKSGMEESDFQIMVQEQYTDWHEFCIKERIATGPILHVLTEPVSFRDTDRHYRQKNGTTAKLTVLGLKLYSKLFS